MPDDSTLAAGGVGGVEATEQMSAADFGQLLSAPPAEGAHFRFSSEKSWDAVDAESDDLFGTQFFRMNVSRMERQLLAVPFYQRQGYAPDGFTGDELRRMRTDAERAAGAADASGVEAAEATSVPSSSSPSLGQGQQQLVSPLSPSDAKLMATGSSGPPMAAETPAAVDDAVEEDDELDALLLRITVPPSPVAAAVRDPQPPSKEPCVANRALPPVADDLQQWLDDILED